MTIEMIRTETIFILIRVFFYKYSYFKTQWSNLKLIKYEGRVWVGVYKEAYMITITNKIKLESI